VDPSRVNLHSCDARNIDTTPFYGDCRWKTQNVSVDHNVFDFNPANMGSSCTVKNACGFQGLFSEYGTYPSWSPYQGTAVGRHITFEQDNHFSSNVYNGPWRFVANEQGDVIDWEQWQAGPYGQDANSIMSGN